MTSWSGAEDARGARKNCDIERVAEGIKKECGAVCLSYRD